MTYVCRNCNDYYSVRAGRGLCRKCWDDKIIRVKYPLLAQFGGEEASKFQFRQEIPDSQILESKPLNQTDDAAESEEQVA